MFRLDLRVCVAYVVIGHDLWQFGEYDTITESIKKELKLHSENTWKTFTFRKRPSSAFR